jgi:hypothetical protein
LEEIFGKIVCAITKASDFAHWSLGICGYSTRDSSGSLIFNAIPEHAVNSASIESKALRQSGQNGKDMLRPETILLFITQPDSDVGNVQASDDFTSSIEFIADMKQEEQRADSISRAMSIYAR